MSRTRSGARSKRNIQDKAWGRTLGACGKNQKTVRRKHTESVRSGVNLHLDSGTLAGAHTAADASRKVTAKEIRPLLWKNSEDIMLTNKENEEREQEQQESSEGEEKDEVEQIIDNWDDHDKTGLKRRKKQVGGRVFQARTRRNVSNTSDLQYKKFAREEEVERHPGKEEDSRRRQRNDNGN